MFYQVEFLSSNGETERVIAPNRMSLFYVTWSFQHCDDIFQFSVYENLNYVSPTDMGWSEVQFDKWTRCFDLSVNGKFGK